MAEGSLVYRSHRAPDVRSVERAEEWDEFMLSAPEGNLLQSFRWGDFKARYGWTVERLMANAEGGATAAQVFWRHTPLGPLAYVPRGPVSQPSGHLASSQALLEALHRSAHTRKAIMLKVEPNSPDPTPWPALGLRPSSQTFQPQATLKVDLAQSMDVLSMRQHRKTRYNIRLAARKGVTVRERGLDALPIFYQLAAETGQRHGIAMRSEGYYRDLLEVLEGKAYLLLAEHEEDTLSGILVARFGREVIYLYGASSGLKRNLMSTYLLQWEAMRRAQEQGAASYDLWGVPAAVAEDMADEGDEGQLPAARAHQQGDLWGVYRFKRGFGGSFHLYSGAYDYVYRPLAYGLWGWGLPRVRRFLPGFLWRLAGQERPQQGDDNA